MYSQVDAIETDPKYSHSGVELTDCCTNVAIAARLPRAWCMVQTVEELFAQRKHVSKKCGNASLCGLWLTC